MIAKYFNKIKRTLLVHRLRVNTVVFKKSSIDETRYSGYTTKFKSIAFKLLIYSFCFIHRTQFTYVMLGTSKIR